jgi:nucleoside-diphosphate-sugar epimerase
MKKVIVAGASGLVGSAAIEHFSRLEDWEVVGISRRKPKSIHADATNISHLSLDLTDAAACDEALAQHEDATHLVYAAVWEHVGDVVEGWQTQSQMETNRTMLTNFLEPLEKAAKKLEHVSLLQGGKAYGVHTFWPEKAMSTPARESEPRHPHQNFYWLQQDYLVDKQKGKAWNWTIFRPQIIFGDPVGSNLSVLAVIGAYAALEREAGRGLAFPGGAPYPLELIDVDLIADALIWAATSPSAQNEIFNIANGDVVVWENVWPVIADAMGMDVAAPRPHSLHAELSQREGEWAALVKRHDLAAPASLTEFIGGSTALTDWTFACGTTVSPPPILLSTIKLRQAGFPGCIDSEVMLRKWIKRLQELRLIPSRTI